jgi:hypothetical protein
MTVVRTPVWRTTVIDHDQDVVKPSPSRRVDFDARPKLEIVLPGASYRMANREPRVPESQKREMPPRPRLGTGEAQYDAEIGCYVRDPAPAPEFETRRPTAYKPFPKLSGTKRFDVWDKATGVRLLVDIRAGHITAVTAALAYYAKANGCHPSDFEVKSHVS